MTESDELARLADLHRNGALSDAEFARAKERVLNGSARREGGALGDGVRALRRSRDDRWLGGVCGGIGRVTSLPSWAWRLLFTALVLCAGTGVVLYLLMWIFIPLEEPAPLRASATA
jgi:phage shock protein PspC (stress-responsive transcriptional regulator)